MPTGPPKKAIAPRKPTIEPVNSFVLTTALFIAWLVIVLPAPTVITAFAEVAAASDN